MKLIDKDALIAWAKETYLCENASMIRKVCYKQLLEHLDTLEVKEVDLEKEFESFLDNIEGVPRMWHSDEQIEWGKDIAKHFFELGLKENQENNVMGILERAVKIDAGGYPYIDCDIEFYDYDKDIPLAKEGDKVKVVIVKGE